MDLHVQMDSIEGIVSHIFLQHRVYAIFNDDIYRHTHIGRISPWHLFTGSEISSRVGDRMVQCSVSVTRLLFAVAVADSDSGDIHGGYERGVDEEGHDVVTQCFFVRFTITNVNECKAVLAVCPKHLKDHSKRERSREANHLS